MILNKHKLGQLKAKSNLNKKQCDYLNEQIQSGNICLDNLVLMNMENFKINLQGVEEVVHFCILARKDVDEKFLLDILELTRRNMKDLYDNSPWGEDWKGGWNDELKLNELSHKMCYYIVAYTKDSLNKMLYNSKGTYIQSSDSLCGHRYDQLSDSSMSFQNIFGFLSFKIELEYGINIYTKYLVGYMYELQVLVKGKGIGKHLVDIFYSLCKTLKLEKLMCTVLNCNIKAIEFYKRCQFTIDEISPKNEPYSILSRIAIE
ncbi:acetyltransferase, GNAT family protein [Cryptosporidium serpentis]